MTYTSMLLGGVARLDTGLELALLGCSDGVDVVDKKVGREQSSGDSISSF